MRIIMVDLHLFFLIFNLVELSVIALVHPKLLSSPNIVWTEDFWLYKLSKRRGHSEIKKWSIDRIHSFLFAVHSLSSKREFNASKSRSILALRFIYLTLIPFNRTGIHPVYSIYTICTILEYFEDLSNRMNLGKYCTDALKNLKSFEFILISLLNCDRF